MMAKMTCKKCHEQKPVYAFFKGSTCLDGYYEYCHECIEKALQKYLYE